MADFECIKGLDEFVDALNQLPQNISKNVLRGCVNAGATVLRNRVTALAPVYEGTDERPDSGRIKRAIYQKQIPELSNDSQQVFYVGVRRGKKQRIKVVKNRLVNLDAYYWTWVEFGHWYVPPTPTTSAWSQKNWRAAHKTGANAIWVEPKPFMRPGFEAGKNEAIDAMVDYLKRRVPDEIRKLGLKAA